MTADTSSPNSTQRPAGIGMVLIVSEQLWPHLACLLHFVAQPGSLSALRILHTDDNDRSAKPAGRLLGFVRQRWPQIDASCVVVGTDATSVRDKVRGAMQKLPEICAWVLNATGGTKTMFGGATDLIGTPGLSVVYKEIGNGPWIELMRENGLLFSRQFEIPPETTDAANVRELVRLQYGEEAGQQWTCRPGESIPVQSILERAAASGWHWGRAFSAEGLPTDKSGVCFERFLGGVLRDFGIRHLVQSLKLTGGGIPLQEIDLVVNHRGTLTIFDCKLSFDDDDIPAVTQVDQAGALRRKLGGLQARYVMVRPNWSYSEERNKLAKVIQVKLWSQKECPELIPRLHRLLALPIPPDLEPADALLRKLFSEGRDVLANHTKFTKTFSEHSDADHPSFYALDSMVGLALEPAHRPWMMVELGGRITLAHLRPDSISDDRWTASVIGAWLQKSIPWADLLSVVLTPAGSCRCELRRKEGQSSKLWLQSWAGRSLFSGEFRTFTPPEAAKSAVIQTHVAETKPNPRSENHVSAGPQRSLLPVVRDQAVSARCIAVHRSAFAFEVTLQDGSLKTGSIPARAFQLGMAPKVGDELKLYVSGVTGTQLQLAANPRPSPVKR